MSFDYFVAVRRQDWPTSQDVQQSLVQLGYPLRLKEASTATFGVSDLAEGLPVVFEGRPVLLEAEVEQATDADDPESLFGYISQCASDNFQITNGDYFLTLTFRSDVDQIRAGLFLAAALILAHHGYGFENQTESHGSTSFAHQMLAEAADPAAFEEPTPTSELKQESSLMSRILSWLRPR